jgi:hypothetical protein
MDAGPPARSRSQAVPSGASHHSHSALASRSISPGSRSTCTRSRVPGMIDMAPPSSRKVHCRGCRLCQATTETVPYCTSQVVRTWSGSGQVASSVRRNFAPWRRGGLCRRLLGAGAGGGGYGWTSRGSGSGRGRPHVQRSAGPGHSRRRRRTRAPRRWYPNVPAGRGSAWRRPARRVRDGSVTPTGQGKHHYKPPQQ